MMEFNIKPLVIALGLSVFSLSAAAQWVADKTVLNNADRAVVTVKFDQSIRGDLYLAVSVNGEINNVTF
ncbi:MAG: hypothetical protein NTV00_02525 [Methylococcales bacterium]|nr:hypothetical protein [Methylococcales bacterium]